MSISIGNQSAMFTVRKLITIYGFPYICVLISLSHVSEEETSESSIPVHAFIAFYKVGILG